MKRKPNAGFSLAALIVFLTAASILMAAAVPAYQIQAKRELEEELIFRGEEYMRAIQKFQRKFGIYPPSVDALTETNGLRFVRRQYKDPITGKDFRLIGINPDGSISGSVVASQAGSNVSLFGDTQRFGSGTGQTTAPAASSSGFTGGTSSPPIQVGTGGTTSQSTPVLGSSAASTPRTGQPSSPQSPTSISGIIGVASSSKESSLKIYNKREKYNEWEFVAILGQPGQGNPTGTTPPTGGGSKQDTPPPKKQ